MLSLFDNKSHHESNMQFAFVSSVGVLARRTSLFPALSATTPLQRAANASTVNGRRTQKGPAKMSGQASSKSARASKVIEGPFEGNFGTWYLTQGDADGVLIYRLCLLTMSVATATAGALALTVGTDISPRVYDALALLSALAFGGSLQTIHIYLKPMHNFLKVLWALGLAGGLALAASPLTGDGVVLTVFDKPALLLAIGWQFVALTGLFFKEAVCFHRLEANLLIALVPLLSGGHFLGALPADAERAGSAVFVALFLVFALRKFTQPARDDIGDMSVFNHLESGGSL